MGDFTRRTLVQGSSVLGAVGAFTVPALLEWAKAWAQTAPWKPERGAQLSLVRPTVFVPEEYEAFVAAMDAFALATGRKLPSPGSRATTFSPRLRSRPIPAPARTCSWVTILCRICFRKSAST